jgi:hypothetical protein
VGGGPQVMGKVDRLHSERLHLPWTAEEDEISSRLRLLTRQLQHPAHPVNALDTLAPVSGWPQPPICLRWLRGPPEGSIGWSATPLPATADTCLPRDRTAGAADSDDYQRAEGPGCGDAEPFPCGAGHYRRRAARAAERPRISAQHVADGWAAPGANAGVYSTLRNPGPVWSHVCTLTGALACGRG